MFGIKPAGIEIDGKALDSLFKAFSLTEADRWTLDWKTLDIDPILGDVGSITENFLGPACHGAGRFTAGAWGAGLCRKGANGGMAFWPSKTSKRPPPGSLSIAAAFSAAGVRGEVNRVAIGLMAGCMNDCASS